MLSKTFLEKNTSRHLFVIAASGPSESADFPCPPGADPQTVWQTLGSKLTKAGSHRPRANGVCIHVFMIGEHSSPHDIESQSPGIRKI